MSDFNDTVRISDLPEAGQDTQGLVTLGTDGQGRSVKIPIGEIFETIAQAETARQAVAARVGALERAAGSYMSVSLHTAETGGKGSEYTVSEITIPNVTVMDNAATVEQEGSTDKVEVSVEGGSDVNYNLYDANDQLILKGNIAGGEGYIDMSSCQAGEYRLQLLNPKGAEKNFKVVKKVTSAPEDWTLRISHRHSGAVGETEQSLEYSTDEGEHWTPVDISGEETLSDEDQALRDDLAAEIGNENHAYFDDPIAPAEFNSIEDLDEYFDGRKSVRTEIVCDPSRRILLRGECDTLEGFNINTLADESFDCDGDLLSLLSHTTANREKASATPRAFAGLFAGSNIAVSPIIPDVLGTGTYAGLFSGCPRLEEVRLAFDLRHWADLAESGITQAFPTFRWLEAAEGENPKLCYIKGDGADRAISEIDEYSGTARMSLSGVLQFSELPTNDVLMESLRALAAELSELTEALDNLSQVATSGSYDDLTDKPTIPAAGSQVHQVTAAELAAAQTGGTLTEGDWYFVTDAGSRSLSLGLDATTALTIWTEQV